MFRVLLLMLILLAGLISGPYLAGNQGYVLIQTPNYNLELSITQLIVLFVIAMVIVYSLEWVVSKFLRLSNNTYSWFSRRKRTKAQKQTLEGLMRLQEGDYSKAEKLIGKNAKHSDEPILNLITAAEAAQQKGDEFAANNYLIQATELAGTDNLLVEIARTRILLQQNKLPAARSSVDSLLVMAHRNVEVLKLAVQIYMKSKAYQALDDILEKIENSGLFSNSEFSKLQHQVEDGILDEKMNEEGQEGLLAWWQEQPRKRRNDNYVRVGLVQRLIECNDHESAYDLALETLKKIDIQSELGKSLLAQLTKLQPVDSSKLVKKLEKLAKQNPNSQCAIQRALAYLHVRANELNKASQAFKDLLACQTELERYDATMAAYVFEQVQDQAAAAQVRALSLQSAMQAQNLNVENTSEKSTALLEEKPQENN